MFQDTVLTEKKFYTNAKAVVLAPEIRDQMLSAIVSLSTNAFGEEIQNFAVNEFVILFKNTQFESLDQLNEECIIRIYGIATKDSNQKALNTALEDALFQFVNRYSRIDIQNKNLEKFQEFAERFEKIFADYIDEGDEKDDLLKESKKMRMRERMREQQYQRNSYTMDRRFG